MNHKDITAQIYYKNGGKCTYYGGRFADNFADACRNLDHMIHKQYLDIAEATVFDNTRPVGKRVIYNALLTGFNKEKMAGLPVPDNIVQLAAAEYVNELKQYYLLPYTP